MNSGNIELINDTSLFSFYYLQGSHTPYTLNANGTIKFDNGKRVQTSLEEQTAGHFKLIGDYIRQMKDLGVYDQSLIILLADHGNNKDAKRDHQPFFWIKRPDQKFTTMQTNHAPITTQKHLIPTIADILNLDNFQYDETVFDIPEDALIERYTRRLRIVDSLPAPLESPKGFNMVIENYYTGDGEDLIDIYNRDYNMIPITVSFY